MGYNNGNWSPSHAKVRDGYKHKTLIIYACPIDECQSGITTYDDLGNPFAPPIKSTCHVCKGSGRSAVKGKKSVYEKDYHRLMKDDRLKAGMSFRK